ncbi:MULTISPECIES: hypothetical protein [Halobacteriovorax]|uniref:Uncharacterized protein n=1 Tax=Halobacteriovorax vibrionivorans TaxID=2152716 RepID=A0ABY0IBW4_9BACT|nr:MULTISPECIES: hypothetical protein [Halobacteriovorax]AYF44305.1 hypothetical protein BALOs_1302 [Halobacteriovorax sp. BALOs_7]RZF20447.1 hypothetical protein DAY19_14905 [Halobacteriovorax vibrionivorans]TGD46620.1 hypothetical protein EP118_11665 [Halobacteriovorax sp. Y22]
MSIFNRNKHKQTFTYFIPTPPQRSTPYQEQAFDLVTKTLNRKNIPFNIKHTAVNERGLWIIIELFGKEENLTKIISDLKETISTNIKKNENDDLEIYYEEHEEFHKNENYKA